MNNKIARGMLLDFKGAMDCCGIPFWLREGTLLGAVRDGDFIKGDKDMDVSVLAKDFIPPDNWGIYSELNDMFQVERRLYRQPFSGLCLKRDGHHIDVMLQFCNKERQSYITWSPPYSDRMRTEMPTEYLDKENWIDFLDAKFRIPQFPREVLHNIYGEFWETPLLNPRIDRRPWMKWRLHWTIYNDMPEHLRKGTENPLTN